MTIAYRLGDSLYLNITNRCSCRCTFCIREEHEGVGDGTNLWLPHEPSLEEVAAALEEHDLAAYREIVFCGFGEPTERLELLLEVCRLLRGRAGCPPIRLNTNGLSDLINQRETASELTGLVDTVSVSLNAPTAGEYLEIVRPRFGAGSFEAMLRFARDCRAAVPRVVLTVVDVIGEEAIAACRRVADEAGIPLRVRVKS